MILPNGQWTVGHGQEAKKHHDWLNESLGNLPEMRDGPNIPEDKTT
jgi:hypothetical protein